MEPNNIDYKADVEKAQIARIWDIAFIAPVLIIIGILPSTPVLARIALIGIGLGTLIYNGYFYFKYKS